MYIVFKDKNGEIETNDLSFEGLNVAKGLLEEELNKINERLQNEKI